MVPVAKTTLFSQLMWSEGLMRNSVENEKHILLDCLHEHLVSPHTPHDQLVFPPQYEDGPPRLRTFLSHQL
jgi:hypothetical protein